MELQIQNERYGFHRDASRHPGLRNGFMRLAKQTFGIDFRPWYEQGFWDDHFLPYVLTFEGEVVASVCVNLLPVRTESQKKLYVQLGGVMTAHDFWGRGLSRTLMQQVLDDWKAQCHVLYLYANDSVVDYYPRFGFERAPEQGYKVVAKGVPQEMQRLDPLNDKDQWKMRHCFQQGNPYAAFQVDTYNLLMFYTLQWYRNDVYYLPEQDTLIVAKERDGHWTCCDIFGNSTLSLSELLGCLRPNQEVQVDLGFTPSNRRDVIEYVLQEDDTTLFVHKDLENPFQQNKMRMPLLSRA